MEKDKAVLLAKELMKKYGLENWSFKFDRAKRRTGRCSCKKFISLSEFFVKNNEESTVKQTLLHEIAHAIVGVNNGHNKIWRAKAKEIGHSGNRCYDSSKIIMPKRKWIGICPNCRIEIQYHRKRKCACADCCNKYNNGNYDEKYLIEWSNND